MATTTSPNVITLKLLIDSKGKRVLFAEAGKDFTDFLFSLLSMPVGTVTRLLSTNGIDMVGSFGKLYQSLENLSDTYIQSNFDKDIILKPKSSIVLGGSATSILSLTNNNVTTSYLNKQLYSCGRKNSSTCVEYVSDDPRAICPGCTSIFNKLLTYLPAPQACTQVGSSSSSLFGSSTPAFASSTPAFGSPFASPTPAFGSLSFASSAFGSSTPTSSASAFPFSSSIPASSASAFSSSPSSSSSSSAAKQEGGIVKGVVTYMIMDDLEVKPMSTISSIALLKSFKVTEVGALEEKTVSVGIDEGLSLLKASLQTKTVLTHVFLENPNN
ncbi:uncharacterized serine-rich protein C215.13-like [Humulus lupulus]|uniref:uncharacterized serine-rich protein C215.13-like n=1 Tax=Humulus lupulus TaxID=3486 RepID=UPI002B4100B8|nr:uncharacterized serine-rich protein C215.13-like [Humulus lupulus]